MSAKLDAVSGIDPCGHRAKTGRDKSRMNDTSHSRQFMKPKPKSKPKYVWCVLYSYDYEGESLEAVYGSHRSAKLHPGGGDETIIRKMRVKS